MDSPLTPITLALLTILLFLPGCSISQALRVEDRTMADVSAMIDEVSTVPVVFIGERHDSSLHHKLQLEVLKGLKAKGKTLAIGMEVFEGSSQKALDAWIVGKAPTDAFVKIYQWNWRNVPFSLYEEIFDFARDNRIPIIALNAPREIIVKVSRRGLASLTSDDKRLLPPGSDAEVSNSYVDFIRLSYGVHGGNGDHLRSICEAQMLRNRVMASRIREYHQRHPEGIMVVIAGGVHARATGGIAAELGNLAFKIILPPVPGLNQESIRPEDADFLLEEPFSLMDMLL